MGPCEDTCGTPWAQKTRLSLTALVGGGRGRGPQTGSAPRSVSDLCPGSRVPGTWHAGCSRSGPSAPAQTTGKQPESDRKDASSPWVRHAALPIVLEDPSDEVSFSSCREHVEPQLSARAGHCHGHGCPPPLRAMGGGGGRGSCSPIPLQPPRSPRAVCCFGAGAAPSSSSFHSFISLVTCHITCHLSLLSPAPPSIITISASNPQRLSRCPLSSLCPKQE